MAQDSIGFMWFGTSSGLYRYDGNSFERFEFLQPGNIEIRSLFVDSKKNLWIATTWEQLFKYDMYRQKLTRCIYDSTTVGKNISQVYKMCEGKNNQLWLASGLGILQMNTVTGKFTRLTNTAARSICLHNDTAWVGGDGNGIKCYNVVTGKPLQTPQEWKFLENPNYLVTELFRSKKGYLWAGTNLGLFMYDNKTITKFYSTNNNRQIFPDNYIFEICDENDAGFTWVATAKGIALYEDAKKGFVQIENNTAENAVSVTEKSAVCVGRDVSGKIWIGTDKSGIFSLYPRKIKVYRHNAGDAASIHSNEIKRVYLFNNNLLASVYGDGIDLINLETNTCTFYPFYNTINAAFNTIQYPSERDNRSIFIGSLAGLFVFDVYTHNYTPALPLKYNSKLKSVQAARYDRNNNLWIGCEEDPGGLFEYDPHTDSLRQFTNSRNGLKSNNINLLANDEDGNIVVCHYTNIQKYNAVADSFNFMKQDGSLFFSSAGICFQKGNNGISYAGTYQNGIFMLDKNFNVTGAIDEDKGLSSNTVLSFLQDGPNVLWASTLWGINKITFNNNDKTKYAIEHFNNTDGLPGEIVVNMAVQEKNNEKNYFLSTSDGLVEAAASAFETNTFKPPVVITSLAVSDTVVSLFGSSHLLSAPIYLTSTINLPYTQNSFQLTFASLNYINSQKNQYAYMLQGVNKDWIYTSKVYSANYSNLKPGTYTFLVKASNDAGLWNEKPAMLQFIIKPPFWQTIWAYLVYAVSIAGAIYGIYLNRIRQYKITQETQLRTMIATQEQERKRISRDLHDDIGTKLSALKLFVSSFKNNLQKHQYRETESLARSTEELIDETIRDVRVMLMNLSPGILEEFGYVTAVEGLVNKINETKIIHIKLVVFGIKQRIAKDHELAMYRVTQELVNNVLKHAGAKNASLQIGYRDDKIILMIEDDGKGFDVTTHKEGYGLKNLDARTKLLQGTMSIDSRPGNGTSVLIEIPYQFN